jgi:type IX secretion system PorP/SprF family membrane protein
MYQRTLPMTRKKVLLLTGLLWSAFSGAQQRPHYTQYVLNQYILNPAISGIENYTDIRASHRHQWVGVQDAPVTTYFTIHAPLGKKDLRTTSTSFSGPGVNPRGRQYWVDYLAAEPHHGIGAQVVNDRTGPLQRFSASLTYAYHIGLTSRMNLSAGFGAGINRVALNASRLDFGSFNIDPAVAGSGVLNRIKPDLSAGLYLYSATFFAGLSVQQVVPERLSFADGKVSPAPGRLVPHLFATAGFRTLLGEDWNLVPSVMMKSITSLPPSIEANVKFQYRDIFWLGGSYRIEDGFAGLAGINISNRLNIGYAYDHTISRLNLFSKGTHEVLVGFMIGSRMEERCPRNVW